MNIRLHIPKYSPRFLNIYSFSVCCFHRLRILVNIFLFFLLSRHFLTLSCLILLRYFDMGALWLYLMLIFFGGIVIYISLTLILSGGLFIGCFLYGEYRDLFANNFSMAFFSLFISSKKHLYHCLIFCI